MVMLFVPFQFYLICLQDPFDNSSIIRLVGMNPVLWLLQLATLVSIMLVVGWLSPFWITHRIQYWTISNFWRALHWICRGKERFGSKKNHAVIPNSYVFIFLARFGFDVGERGDLGARKTILSYQIPTLVGHKNLASSPYKTTQYHTQGWRIKHIWSQFFFREYIRAITIFVNMTSRQCRNCWSFLPFTPNGDDIGNGYCIAKCNHCEDDNIICLECSYVLHPKSHSDIVKRGQNPILYFTKNHILRAHRHRNNDTTAKNAKRIKLNTSAQNTINNEEDGNDKELSADIMFGSSILEDSFQEAVDGGHPSQCLIC